MGRGLLLLLFPALLVGCASHPSMESGALIPSEAIVRAAANPGRGVQGRFEFKVANVRFEDGVVHLDSERDYHDQRCLTLDLAPAVVDTLVGQGTDVTDVAGKHVVAHGTALMTRVLFTNQDGIPNGAYFYRTHVRIDSIDSLQIH